MKSLTLNKNKSFWFIEFGKIGIKEKYSFIDKIPSPDCSENPFSFLKKIATKSGIKLLKNI